MCNKEGKCSGRGEPHVISELQNHPTQPATKGTLSGKQIGWIAGSVTLGVILAVILLFLFCKWHREVKIRKLGLKPLGDHFDLDNPTDQHEYDEPDPKVEHHYHRVGTNVNQETA